MTQLVLSMHDHNFRWPGKIQALIYRIHAYRRDELFLPVHNINSHLKDMINVWVNNLFTDGTFSDFFYDFEEKPDIHTFGSSMNGIRIEFQVGMEKYTIRINLNRDIYSCCDVHALNENWRMGGVNIFSVNYTHDIKHPHAFGGPEDRIVAENNGDVFIPPSDVLIKASMTTIAKNFNMGYTVPEKKESKEFTDLKNKISDMASVIRDQDEK